MQVTPSGSVDRFWTTDSTNIGISNNFSYKITGYLKSGSGNINVKVFLHSASDKSIIYSDRIAETYASQSGRTFTLYLRPNTAAGDARLTLETSNPNVSYEVDELSMMRMNITSTPTPNNTNDEVYIMSNTGSSTLTQSCPGLTCNSSHLDVTSPMLVPVPNIALPSLISWPLNIAPHRTRIALLTTGSDIVFPPLATLTPTS